MFDPNGIDVVIPLGNGSRFKDMELRYCLRSLEKFARGIRRVVIVGAKPKWLSEAAVHYHCPYFDGPKDARIAFKTLWTFENLDVSDEILFANDDYVFLQAFDVRTVPPFQRGLLLAAAGPRPGKEITEYQAVLKATAELLMAAKYPAYHYDIHVPIRYLRQQYIALKPWWDKAKAAPNGLVVKSIYANVTRKGVVGPFLADCKLATYGGFESLEKLLAARFPGRFVISYSDAPLYSSFEDWLYKHFPLKSRFEL